MTDAGALAPTRKRDVVELVATVLLAMAAVATAWSGYQANRWSGEQAKASSRTNALRISAARAEDLANADTQVDIATFVQWVDAFATNAPGLQEFYEKRFRPEFKPAFDAWIATNPFADLTAPLSPFAMPEYRLAATADAKRFDRAAAASSEVVQRNIQRSTNYVLGVVLFAIALFFAGISTKVEAPGSRKALLGIGCVVFVVTVAWIATFPVTLSI